MSQSLILIDALSSACWEKKKKEKEAARDYFPTARGQTRLAGCAWRDFSQLLGTIED
jgi:hypothetical protein